jgi:hypothetical protein
VTPSPDAPPRVDTSSRASAPSPAARIATRGRGVSRSSASAALAAGRVVSASSRWLPGAPPGDFNVGAARGRPDHETPPRGCALCAVIALLPALPLAPISWIFGSVISPRSHRMPSFPLHVRVGGRGANPAHEDRHHRLGHAPFPGRRRTGVTARPPRSQLRNFSSRRRWYACPLSYPRRNASSAYTFG